VRSILTSVIQALAPMEVTVPILSTASNALVLLASMVSAALVRLMNALQIPATTAALVRTASTKMAIYANAQLDSVGLGVKLRSIHVKISHVSTVELARISVRDDLLAFAQQDTMANDARTTSMIAMPS